MIVDQQRLGDQLAVATDSRRAAGTPGAELTGVSGQRRHLTLLFADLVGSTRLSTQLDPEDLGHLILSFQRNACAAIERSGGFLARFFGDGLLAYFGWPSAAENDAERAVRAGLAVIQATSLLAPGHGKLQVRVGIESGLVFIGEVIGQGSAEELPVVGEAANLAARLHSLAEPDTVVIGPGTRQRLGQIFELHPLGSLALKGFEVPVPAWQVRGENRVPLRFMAGHDDPLAGLIGRQRELAALSQAWEAARRKRGGAVLLSGEAGVGKSRIVAAFAQGLETTAHTRLLYQCSAVHSLSVLHPIFRELERSAGFEPTDPPTTRHAKLERLFDQSDQRRPGALELISEWMGISAAGADKPSASDPTLRKKRTFALLLERITLLARELPVLVLLEDAHWSDPTTFDLIRELLEIIECMPILAVITTRPEGLAAWRALPITACPVERLTPAETEAMIKRIAGSRDLPPSTVSEVRQKTQGVPLFVEELSKALLESAVAERSDPGMPRTPFLSTGLVPATLQDFLMERLDRLGWAKELAQTGAVLGWEFTRQLLSLVSNMASEQLDEGLERLVESELLTRRDAGNSEAYTFRHALLQDAAYASLLNSQRRVLHGRVAAILLETFPHAVEGQPETVARHLTEAQLFADAIRWWRKAGQRGVRTSANTEAIGHFTYCLQLLERLPDDHDREVHELEIRTDLAVPLMSAVGYVAPQFKSNFTRALELSRKNNDIARLFPALWAQWTATYSGGDMASSEVMSRGFLQEAERRGDRAMMVIGHRIHGVTRLARGDLKGARNELEESLSLYQGPEDDDLTYVYGQNQKTAALSYLCLVMHQLGYMDRAVAIGEQAISEASRLGHFNTLGYALAQILRLHMLRRDPTSIRRVGQTLAELSEQHEATSWSLVGRIAVAIAEASTSSDDAALTTIRSGIRELQSRSWNYWVPWLLLEEARVLIARHDMLAVTTLLDEAQHLIEVNDHRFCEPNLAALRAQLLEEQGEPSHVVSIQYRRAIDAALAQEAIVPALRAATRLASLPAGQDDRAETLARLAGLLARFSEGLETPDLLAAKACLDGA